MASLRKYIYQSYVGGSGGSVPCAFEGTTTIGGGTVSLTFPNLGAINGVPPTNITDVFEMSTSGTYYVIATITTNTNVVSSSTLSISTTKPGPPSVLQNSAPMTLQVVVGVIVNGVYIRTAPCNGYIIKPIEAFREVINQELPFSAKYKVWYTWSIGGE